MTLALLLQGGEAPRRGEALVRAALADTRVVALQGARQVGKSTLGRTSLAGRGPGVRLDLDDPATRGAAAADPTGFLAEVASGGTVMIDEIHRVPELILAIKAAVDRDRRPGQFLLTGSAHLLSIPGLSESLAGRAEYVTLWPFSQGELHNGPDGFLARLMAGASLSWNSAMTRRDYADLVVAGGYPEAVRRTDPGRRSRWYASYVASLVTRDIPGIARVDHLEELPRLLRLAASRTAQVASADALAGELGIAANTVRRYLSLLEMAFVVARLPAWASNATSRLVKRPKLHVVDSGLGSYLRGPGAVRTDADPGPAFESFVAMELMRQASWLDDPLALSHLRSRDGHEVDVVVETPDGRIAGVEVKASATPRPADFAGLRHLAAMAGERFVGGVVLHTGPQSVPFGRALWAHPIEAVWAAGSISTRTGRS